MTLVGAILLGSQSVACVQPATLAAPAAFAFRKSRVWFGGSDLVDAVFAPIGASRLIERLILDVLVVINQIMGLKLHVGCTGGGARSVTSVAGFLS